MDLKVFKESMVVVDWSYGLWKKESLRLSIDFHNYSISSYSQIGEVDPIDQSIWVGSYWIDLKVKSNIVLCFYISLLLFI